MSRQELTDALKASVRVASTSIRKSAKKGTGNTVATASQTATADDENEEAAVLRTARSVRSRVAAVLPILGAYKRQDLLRYYSHGGSELNTAFALAAAAEADDSVAVEPGSDLYSEVMASPQVAELIMQYMHDGGTGFDEDDGQEHCFEEFVGMPTALLMLVVRAYLAGTLAHCRGGTRPSKASRR